MLAAAGFALAATLVAAAIWLYTPDRPRAALEALYLAASSDYVQAAGMRLHVRDSGPREAPAIVLLHGFGSSLHTWEAWAGALAGRYRVIRLDLPGSGLTGPDPTGDYSDRRSREVLAALMDRLAVRRATFVGNSIGGRIAWSFAAATPERVDKLVLISPDGFASPGTAYGTAPKIPAWIGLFRYVLPTALVRSSLKPAYGDPSLLAEATVARYRDLMLAPGVRGAMIARLEQSTKTDPEPLLRAIQAPTLLLWGDRDALIPVSNAADYARLIPDTTAAILSGLGHVPMEEAPDVSLEPVRRFLER